MERAGLNVLNCKYDAFTRPNGMTGMAIKAIGEVNTAQGPKDLVYTGTGESMAQIRAGRIDQLRRFIQNPAFWRNLLRTPDQ